jgi:hypothetical protein
MTNSTCESAGTVEVSHGCPGRTCGMRFRMRGIGARIPREADADPTDALTNFAAWVPASRTPARASRRYALSPSGCEPASPGIRTGMHEHAWPHPRDACTHPREERGLRASCARACRAMGNRIIGMRPSIARTRALMTWNVPTHTSGWVSPSRACSTPSRACDGPSLGTAACFPQNRARMLAHGRGYTEGSARACGTCAHTCANSIGHRVDAQAHDEACGHR